MPRAYEGSGHERQALQSSPSPNLPSSWDTLAQWLMARALVPHRPGLKLALHFQLRDRVSYLTPRVSASSSVKRE